MNIDSMSLEELKAHVINLEKEIVDLKVASNLSIKPEAEMSRQERYQEFIKVCKSHKFIRPINIMNCVNGQMSVSQKTKKLKLPLEFHWPDLMDEANLGLFNSIDHSKIFICLMAVDLIPEES